MYIVIDEDRHTDVGVYLFDNAMSAVEKARQIALDGCRGHEEDIEEDRSIDGWIIDIAYSGEGDHVRVQEIEVE